MIETPSAPHTKPEDDLFPELSRKSDAPKSLSASQIPKPITPSVPPPPSLKTSLLKAAPSPARADEAESLDWDDVEEPEEAETLDARDVAEDDETAQLPEALDDAEVEDERTPPAASSSALDALGASLKPKPRALHPKYDAELDDGPTVALSSSVLPVPASMRNGRPASLPPPSARASSLPPLPMPPTSKPSTAPPVSVAPPVSARVPGALLSSRGAPPHSVAPAPHSLAPQSFAPVAPPASTLDSGRMSIPPVAESVTSHTQMNPPRPSRWPIFAAAAVVLVLGTGAVAAVGGMALGLGGKNEGTVVVTASGVGGRAIDGVRVIVDGVQKCNASPCRVDGLAAGTRLIHAEAPGFEPTAARAVSVESGAESALHVELLPVAKAEPDAPASAKADEPSPAKADEPSPAKADAPAAAQAKAAAPAAAKAPVAAAPGAKASTGKKDETKAADAPQPAAMGTLNVNSIPRSNVVVNGRPMGMTPVMGLSVPAGPQTVVFVHPELGRKVGSASVQAGGSATIAVRFE